MAKKNTTRKPARRFVAMYKAMGPRVFGNLSSCLPLTAIGARERQRDGDATIYELVPVVLDKKAKGGDA